MCYLVTWFQRRRSDIEHEECVCWILIVPSANHNYTIVPRSSQIWHRPERLPRSFDMSRRILARLWCLTLNNHRPLDQSKVRPTPLINSINQIQFINDSSSDFSYCEYRHASYFSKYESYFSAFVSLWHIQGTKRLLKQRSLYCSMSEGFLLCPSSKSDLLLFPRTVGWVCWLIWTMHLHSLSLIVEALL